MKGIVPRVLDPFNQALNQEVCLHVIQDSEISLQLHA